MSRLVLSDTTDVFARQLSSDPTVSFVPAETTVYPPLVPNPSLNGRVHISRAEPHRDDLTLERVGCERDNVSYHACITSRQRKLLPKLSDFRLARDGRLRDGRCESVWSRAECFRCHAGAEQGECETSQRGRTS